MSDTAEQQRIKRVTHAMIRAASESRARDDEGEFLPLFDLLGFSGQNKTHTVIRAALEAALDAALAPSDDEAERALIAHELATGAYLADPTPANSARLTHSRGRVEKFLNQGVASRVAEATENSSGCWRACSGCQESNEGYISPKLWPYDPVYRCQPGSGCSECGGIGVIWDAALTPQAPAGLDAIDPWKLARHEIASLIRHARRHPDRSADPYAGDVLNVVSHLIDSALVTIRAELDAARGGSAHVDPQPARNDAGEILVCMGCGSSHTLSRLKEIGCVSCCPEREMIPVRDLWRSALSPQPQPAPDRGVVVLEGWMLVPIEPTQTMLDAHLGLNKSRIPEPMYESRRDLRPLIYRAMLSAAPPVRPSSDGGRHTNRSVPCPTCGFCIRKVERPPLRVSEDEL